MVKVSIVCCCVFCKKEYPVKGLTTHINRTHLKMTNYSSGNHGKYEILAAKSELEKDKKVVEYLLNPKYCKSCDSVIDYDRRKNFFWSHSCSASTSNKPRDSRTVESRRRLSEKMMKPRFIKMSDVCHAEFKTLI